MKRDKFDELLKNKLENMEAAPPDDMWARLEARLPEIRRDLSFGADAGHHAPDGALPGMAEPLTHNGLPAPKIRRPLRRKMRWAYVAASFAVAVTMMFALRNLQDESMMAGNEPPVEDAVVEPPVEVVPSGDGVGVVASPGIGSGVVAARVVRGSNGRSINIRVVEPDGGLTDVQPLDFNPVSDEAGDADKVAEDVDNVQNKDGAVEPPVDNIYQGSGNSGLDDDAARRLAEWQNSRRRTSTVSTSLYAANAAGTNNVSGNITSRTKLYKSSLVVKEQDNYPDDEEYASTNGRDRSTEYKLKHDLPLSFGASVDINLTGRLHLETGLYYTYMRSKGETTHSELASSTMTQKLHYLGLPVKLRYDFMQTRFVDLYASAGGSAEKLLSGKQVLKHKSESNLTDTNAKLKVSSLQGSVGLNLGAAFNIDRNFGLYLEPGIGYFFENGNQPESYRTENPFNFTIKAGVRIKL